MLSPSLAWRCSKVVVARENPSLHRERRPHRAAVHITSGQLGPRLSACDELAQRQVQAVQPRDDSARHGLQAIGGKQERNHQINDAAHRVADEEQSHAQQSHNDRGRCQEEGGQGEQEQQDSHKDGQEQDKRCGDQFKYQSHRFDPFLSFSTYILPCGRRGNNVADG